MAGSIYSRKYDFQQNLISHIKIFHFDCTERLKGICFLYWLVALIVNVISHSLPI